MEIEDLTCRGCGAINSTNIIEKGVHHMAYCAKCGAWIKNIAYNSPCFYFGKYKGKEVAAVHDIGYLEWFLREVKKPGKRMFEAVQRQVDLIKNGPK
jgi:uncharacterized protein (DUF3820 family)